MSMSTPEFRYNLNVSIQITGTEAKKDTVRDAVLAILNTAHASGNIDEATWSISQNTVPEGGVIK
jgi:hypothetical protein